MRKAMMFLQQYMAFLRPWGQKSISSTSRICIESSKKILTKWLRISARWDLRFADEIAAEFGIHTDSDYHIRSGLLYILLQSTVEGHVYLPQKLLLQRAEGLLGVKAQYMEKHIADLSIDRKIVLKEIETQAGKERIVYASRIIRQNLYSPDAS